MRSLEPASVVTRAIIAINVLALVVEFFAGGSLSSRGGGSIVAHGALYGPAIAFGDEYWRLITGGFLHAGIIHLGFNMWILWIVGQLLEPAVGSVRFATMYFVALLAGSFGALLITPDSATVGASGAVFGVMAGALVALRGHGFDPLRSGLGITLLLNVVLTFAIPGISIGGHIGGMIGGALAAWILVDLRNRFTSLAIPLALCVLAAAGFAVAGVAVAGGSGLG